MHLVCTRVSELLRFGPTSRCSSRCPSRCAIRYGYRAWTVPYRKSSSILEGGADFPAAISLPSDRKIHAPPPQNRRSTSQVQNSLSFLSLVLLISLVNFKQGNPLVILVFSLSFLRILWVRLGQKILGNFEIFLDKTQKTKEKKDRAGGGAYFAFFLGSDNSHTTPPPKKKYHHVWGWCVVGGQLLRYLESRDSNHRSRDSKSLAHRIAPFETYPKSETSKAIKVIPTVFGVAIRIVRFEFAANRWRFEFAANCEPQFKTSKVNCKLHWN